MWPITCGADRDLKVILQWKSHHSYSPLIADSCFRTLPDAHAGVRGHQPPAWGERSFWQEEFEMIRWSAGCEDLWPGEALFKNIPSWVKGVEDHASIFHLPLSSTTCTLLQDFTKTQMWSSEGWLHTLTSSFCFLGKISTDTNVHKGGSYRIIMFLMRRRSFPEVCSVIGFTVNNFW